MKISLRGVLRGVFDFCIYLCTIHLLISRALTRTATAARITDRPFVVNLGAMCEALSLSNRKCRCFGIAI